MDNELDIIKKFILTLRKKCNYYQKSGCACNNLCGMAKVCHKGFKVSEEEIEELYKIYLNDETEYIKELELAKKIREYGIEYRKLEQIIDAMK